MNSIPEPRGALSENRSLADLTWLRVGGPAEYFFQPADTDDLADFLRASCGCPCFPDGCGQQSDRTRWGIAWCGDPFGAGV